MSSGASPQEKSKRFHAILDTSRVARTPPLSRFNVASLFLSLSLGRRHNGVLGLSLNDRTILFLLTLLDKTVSVG